VCVCVCVWMRAGERARVSEKWYWWVRSGWDGRGDGVRSGRGESGQQEQIYRKQNSEQSTRGRAAAKQARVSSGGRTKGTQIKKGVRPRLSDLDEARCGGLYIQSR
jgi:hypothetical protein